MKIKKLVALLLAVVLVATCIPTMIVGAYTGKVGTELTNPLAVSPTSSGVFTWGYDDNSQACFRFTLTTKGILTFNCTKLADASGKVQTMYFYVYNANNATNGNEIWSNDSYYYSGVAGNYNFQIPLNAGTYIFKADPSFYLSRGESQSMNYAFGFSAKTNWETEPNNGAALANPMALNATIYGNTGGNYGDYFYIKATKNTPVRLKIGNYSALEEKGVYYSITYPDGTEKSLYNIINAGSYGYVDVLLKSGVNTLKISSKNPSIQYWLYASTTDIEYKAPVIKKVSIDYYYYSNCTGKVTWEPVEGIDGYEVYRKTGSGSWKFLKDLNSKYYDGISMYDIVAGKKYQIKVRAYKMFDTIKYYGNWSKAVSLNTTPSNIKLSATSYAYNGKTKTPSVVIKDINGNKLVKGTDYTLKYSSGRKKIGTYKVTITFKGKYSGKVTKKFKIVPKGTSVSKVTSGSKKLKVSWKKQKTQTTGYQIQISTSSKFASGNKAYTIKKNSTLSTTLKNLKAKKTYYVRIRTYKSVNGAKYYSAWSKVLKKATK